MGLTEKKMDLSPRRYGAEFCLLGSYLGLMVAYGAATIAREKILNKRSAKPMPAGFGEFALLAVGSYKLSRVVTLSFVTSPLRAPFTRKGKKLSAGEVQDEPRGSGFQQAMGDLLTCPFCFNVWPATALFTAFAFKPESTKRFASILAAAALGDFLHHGYKFTREEVA